MPSGIKFLSDNILFRISFIDLHMIVDAPPSAMCICGHADIMFSAVGHFITGSTVSRLHYITGLGTDHFSVRLFIFDPPQEPVGYLDSLRVLFRRRCCISMCRHDFPAQFIFHRRFQDHCHIIDTAIMIFIIQTHTVGKMCTV